MRVYKIKLSLFLGVILLIGLFSCNEDGPTSCDNVPELFVVPEALSADFKGSKNLADVYKTLNGHLTSEQKLFLSCNQGKYLIPSLHFTFGRWIRKEFKLWEESKFFQYFQSNKVTHPDEMSAIIMLGYFHHLNGENKTIEFIIEESANLSSRTRVSHDK